jgi:alcohol/geraniol dehydrogenase (NADP+)
MKVQCYATMGEKQPLEQFEYEAQELGDFDVQVSITHCGICYSDVHFIDNDAGFTTYPFVPGHEIVGNVSALGDKVTALKEGDRVGIGWQARSCRECEWCIRGEENLCPEILQSATWTPYGGFASAIVVDSRFAFPLPDNLEPENVGPLMCGGITVYCAITI